MAIWPFGRSKRAKNARGDGVARSATYDEKQALTERAPARAMSPIRRATTPAAVAREKSTKPSPRSMRTLRKESKSPAPDRSRTPQSRREEQRQEELPFGVTTTVSGGKGSAYTTPLPPKQETIYRPQKASQKAEATRRPLKELGNNTSPGSNNYRPELAYSKTSLGQDSDFTAMPIIPTLTPIAKSSNADSKLARRKSSKRIAEDKQRIDELRDMSRTSPIPIPTPKRPRSDASGLLARESRRSPNLTRRPNSEISLPLAESLHDSAPEMPQSQSYKVNAFDMFAPRPTIKYNSNPRFLKSSHRKDKDKEAILPETDEDWSSRARMNELADDLDARALRELMDRDRRRRERKKKTDADKLTRKLEKKAAQAAQGKGKEREEEGAAAATAAAPAAVATGTSTSNNAKTDLNTSGRSQQVLEDPFASIEDEPSYLSRASPVSPLEDPFQDRAESEAPIVETAQAVHYAQPTASAPSSPLLTKGQQNVWRPETDIMPESLPAEIPEPPPQLQPDSRRDSETSSRKTGGGGGLMSLFRRGQRNNRASTDKGKGAPSESNFSNASHESFAKTGPSAAAEAAFVRTGGSGGPSQQIVPQRSFRRSGASVRTTSKFREDLPDVPAVPPIPSPIRSQTPPPAVPAEGSQSRPQSPPHSRVSSPDAGSGPPSPFVDNPHMLSTDAAIHAPMEDVHPALRQEVALSRGPSRRSSQRDSAMVGERANPALLSQSLASVDSEGSWLSGRPSKRSSTITGRQSSNSISGAAPEDEGRNSITGSPLIFSRRSRAVSQSGNGAGSSSISNQLHALRHPNQPGDVASGDERTSPTPPEGSIAPTPIRLSGIGVMTGGLREGNSDSAAVLHTDPLARSPTFVSASNAAQSREGLLDIFDPQPSSAVIESAEGVSSPESLESPTATESRQRPASHKRPSDDSAGSPESPVDAGSPETEQPEIKRATSVTLRGDRGHARQISAGSARLLDVSRRASGEASKFTEGRRDSSGSAARMSDLANIETRDSNRLSRLAMSTSAGEGEEASAVLTGDEASSQPAAEEGKH